MWSLVRQAATGLRYQTVSPLIGQRITVTGWPSFEADVESWVESQMPGCKSCEDRNARQHLVYARYGFADFTFDAAELSLDSVPVGGVPLLKNLGFAWNRRRSAYQERHWMPEYADPANDFQEAVEDLAEEIEQSQLYLRVFFVGPKITDDDNWRAAIRAMDSTEFPMTIDVVDACLTNSPGVWINKHFYW